MREDNIIHIALENLQKNVGITGNWRDFPNQTQDGQVDFVIDNQHIVLNVEIKQEIRNYQLPQIYNQANLNKHFIVVARRIFPKIKEELRHRQIGYLEANGNIYLHEQGITLWIDAQKPIEGEKVKVNRAFTKTGLKVIFHFLQNENNINLPYREIAERTQVGLGNINYIINGLKEMGFLIRLNKDEVKLINKKELLDKWITAYEEKLKPNLKIGTFRLMNNNTIDNWKLLPLQHNKTCWGGEPAGDILTNYLRPAELTLYTIETRNELIKNYQLMPDETGNVNVYKKFWRQDLEIDNEYIAPPILVYADLINTDDKRCRETAERIYEQYIQPNI